MRVGRTSVPVAAVVGIVCIGVGTAPAAPGDLDPSFGARGKVFLEREKNRLSEANDLLVTPDGRMLAIGHDQPALQPPQPVVFGFGADGGLDPGFGSSGRVDLDLQGIYERLAAGALQADGRIVLVGCRYAVDTHGLILARLTGSGHLDPSFGDGGIETTGIEVGRFSNCFDPIDVALQPDGRIVVTAFGGGGFLVVRFLADGTLDPEFGNGGIQRTSFDAHGSKGRSSSVQVASDGRIFVAGTLPRSRGRDRFAVVAYTPAGELDTSFSGDALAKVGPRGGDALNPVLALDGSRPVVAGAIYNDGRTRVFASRLTADGSADTSFGRDGLVQLGPRKGFFQVGDVAISSRGGAVIAGSTGADFFVARWRDTGKRDLRFSGNGRVATDLGGRNDGANALAISADGRTLVAGTSASYYDRGPTYEDLAIVRYLNEPGPPDGDADGIGDRTDRCPTVPGPSGQDCPVHGVELHLFPPFDHVDGYVRSDEPRCTRVRMVTLYEKRPGGDHAVARAESDRGGSFEFGLPERGRYYATMPRGLVPLGGICRADTSNAVKVR